ncbi:MAG: type II secretion system F family protein [Candidatus Heimdallarchaeota archaeon]|nr:type II secretion system F family protein [Candidatus Heimdallarchaeota archaeon]
MAEKEDLFYKKLKGQRKGLGQSGLIWLLAIGLALSFITIGILDYTADYEQTSDFDDQVTIVVGEGANAENRTLQPIFGIASYQKPANERGFLPDSIDISLHEWIVMSFVILLGLPALLIYEREGRRLTGIDNNLPNLLREIADSQRIGMHLPRAIAEASKRNYGPLTKELKKLAAKVSWGIPFRDAMLSFREALDTPLAKQATILILEAERSGGELEKIFDSAKEYVQELLDIKKDRESAIKPYIYIVFISYLIFAVVIYVLFTTFFAPFAARPITSSTGEEFIAVPFEAFKVGFLYMLTTQAFFSGLTAGKMGKGSVKLGVLYSSILMLIGLIFHKFLIVRQSDEIVYG